MTRLIHQAHRRFFRGAAMFVMATVGVSACSSTSPKAATDSVVAVAAEKTNSNAADTTGTPGPSTDDVFTAASATGDYPTFVKLAEQAGLADSLRTGGPFTVAIPTEAAFAAVPKETLHALLADSTELARVLRYHVVSGLVKSEPSASGPVPTLEGSTIDVVFTKTSASINGATILTAPRVTANGAYVAIDAVLLPPKP